MHYDTVEITPSGGGEWAVGFSTSDKDRIKVINPVPNSLGFFHYPRRWSKQKAFTMLRDHLVKMHNEEIDALIKSRNALLGLPVPDKNKVKK